MQKMSSEMKKILAQAQAVREVGIGSDVSAKSFETATKNAEKRIDNTDFGTIAATLEGGKTKTVWDMQKKKEDAAFAKVTVEPTKIKRDRTKKEYDDFLEKAEFDASSASDRKRWEQQRLRLQANAELAEKEYQQEEERRIIEEDLEAITGLPEDERKQLEQYASGREVDFYEGLGAASRGDFSTPYVGRAEQNISGLIQKYGYQRVMEMANTMERVRNAEMTEDVAELGKQQANDGFWSGAAASAASVPVSVLASANGIFDRAKEMMWRDDRFHTLDPNSIGNLGNVYAGAVRGQVGQNITDTLGDGLVGNAVSVAYQGVMSAADSVARAFLGGSSFGGAALAATNTFSQVMADASRQGATPAQAALLATVNSGIEALSEKIPLDNLIRTAKGQGAKTVLKNMLRQMGIEATTEEISLIGTVLAEASILQEKSGYQQDIFAAIGGGATPDEAIRQASQNLINEAVNTALVSMVSGGVSSLGGSYADARGMFAQDQQQNNPVLNKPKNAQQASQTAIENNQARRERMGAKQVAKTFDVEKDIATAPESILTALENQRKDDQWSDRTAPFRIEDMEATENDANAMQWLADRGMAGDLNKSLNNIQTGKYQLQQPDVAQQAMQQPQTTQEAPQQAETQQPTQPQQAQQQPPQPQTQQNGQVTTQASAPTVDMQMGANNQSAEGGQQAETQPETPKMQRDRINSARDQAIPETDMDGRKNSEAAGNIYTSSRTPDSFAENIRRIVNEGRVSHDVQTNEESLNKAAASIAADGSIQNALNSIKEVAKSGRTGALDVAKGVLIYDELVRSSDSTHQALAEECFVTLTELATNTGRPMQLFSLFRKMTPESQLRTMERAIQRNVERFQKNGSVKKDFRPVFNQELEQNYLEAARDAMNAKSDQARQEAEQSMQELQNAMYLESAAQMPATFKAKWDAWRYMAMLGNVKTQVRNFFGNLAFKPYKEVKDKMGALAEKLFVPKDQRTKSLVTDKALVKWARGDAGSQSVNEALKYSAKLGDDVSGQKFRENMQVFNNKTLDSVRKFVESVPGRGDMLYKNGYYAKSLAGFLKARGYTAADVQNDLVSQEVMGEARAYAIQEAMKATFNDSNAFSDFLATDLRYKGDNPIGKALNIAAEGVLPFRRTPANIAVRFTEYSPVGVAKGLWNAATKVRKGEMTAATAIDQLTSGLTGSAVMALGFALAGGLNGIKITGSGTDEDEKRQGHQDYALEFSIDGQEYSYKIDWAAPANLPLFVGANIYSALENAGEDTDVSKFTSFIRGMGTMFEPLLALSCMSSLNDLVEGVRYAEEGEALYTIASQVATSYFTQGIPSLARQATQAFTENKQTTFTTSDDPTIRDLQSTAAGLGVGNAYKTDKVTAWGEKESQGGAVERAVNAFLNPGTLKRIDNSAVEQEITRLNGAGQDVTPDKFAKTVSYIDKDGFGHDDVRLTEEQYQTLAQTQGQTARKLLDEMIQSESYKGMTDEQKADAINTAYQYARMTGEIAAIEDHTGYDQSWMYDVEKGGANEIIRRTLNSGINTAMGDLDNAWDKDYDDERFVQEMENMFRSYQNASAAMKKQVYAEASGTAKKYIEVRDKGLSHTDALSAIKNVATVKGTGSINKETGKATVRDIDRRQAIANTTGLSEKEIDIMMKAYMADYDPSDESPETTEFKYQHAREELGLSPKEYANTYRAYLDNSKKAQKIKAIRALGYDYKTANALYKLYYGRMKNDLIEMYG